MRKRAKQPLGNPALNAEPAQLPTKLQTSAPDDLAALIDRITDQNRHDLADTGRPVGRDVW